MAEYRVSLCSSFSITINKHTGKEIIDITTFITFAKERKYLEINPFKEVKDLYNENVTSLKTEIKENTRKWKDVMLMIGRIKTVIMTSLPKQFTDSVQSESKSP